jgi:2-amino-4-hydroxy-6-hydroxymethyldihydropteridine diphosphokinase
VVESEPWGFDAETTFYNHVLLVETQLSPHQVLNSILDIEKELGRIRSGKTYSSRNIDIDILFYAQQQIETANLVIPHPLMHIRGFVLVPLAMLAPDLVHPVFQITVSELLTLLKDNDKITVIATADEFTELIRTSKLN